MNPLQELNEYGQSVWLDFVSRDLLEKRRAGKLIERRRAARRHLEPVDLREGDRRRRRLRRADRAGAEASGDLDAGRSIEDLAVDDIQEARRRAAPGLRRRRSGRDGYVSLEVSPYLAMRHARDDRGGAAAVARGRPAEPDGQGARHQAGHPGDPHADRRRHQRQRHAAVRARRLCSRSPRPTSPA